MSLRINADGSAVRALPPRSPALAAGATYSGLAAAVLALGHLANDLMAGSFSALLPSLQQRFSLSEAWLATLAAIFSFGVAFPQPFLGALADRMDRRGVTVMGMALTSILVSLVGVVPTPAALLLLLTVAGLGSAALHPAASSLAGALGGGRAGVAVGMFIASGMLGGALGPLAILALVGRFGLESTPWLMVPGLLLAAVLYLGIPPYPPGPDSGATRLPSLSLFTGPVGLMAITAAFGHLPMMAISSALPLWLVRQWGIPTDAPLLGLTLATFSLSAAIGAVGAGAAERWIPRHFLVPGTLILAPLPMFATLVTEPGSAPFFAAVGLGGLLAYASVPLLVVAAQERTPHQRSAASGMVTGLGVGMAAVGYVGIGHLQELLGIATALRWAFLATLPAAALGYVALRSGEPVRVHVPAGGAVCECAPCVCVSACTPACVAALT